VYKYIAGAVAGAVLVGGGLGIGLTMTPAGASSGPKTTPIPYETEHAWAETVSSNVNTGDGPVPLPTGDRVAITGWQSACGYGYQLTGTLNGTSVTYELTPGGPNVSAYGNVNENLDLDGSSSASVAGIGCPFTISGYTIPLP
jgi:hypothetical protein